MRIFVVDAFTDIPFSGNPAGVCPLDGAGDPGWMQRVAAELNLSETAFVRPVDEPDADYELRWFTPTVEVDLCGHATVATTHALHTSGRIGHHTPVRYATRSGVLRATPGDDAAITLDFPADPPTPGDPPEGLSPALDTPVLRFAQGRAFALAELGDAAAVRSLHPDLAAMQATGITKLIVTAPGDDPGTDCVSRVFAPGVGIDEDPVTGSAHCMLGPYWAGRLGRTTLHAHQASPRGGRMDVTPHGDRVELTGRAVTVIDGELRTV